MAERTRTRRRRNAGATLIDAAIGTALIAIALAGTASSIVSANALTAVTRETRIAARASSGILESVRATPVDQLVDTYDGSTFAVQTLNDADPDGTATVSVTEIDNGSTRWMVYEVAVTVSWDSAASTREIRQVTMVCDRAYGTARARAQLEAGGAYEDPGAGGDPTATADPTATTDPTVAGTGTTPSSTTTTTTTTTSSTTNPSGKEPPGHSKGKKK